MEQLSYRKKTHTSINVNMEIAGQISSGYTDNE